MTPIDTGSPVCYATLGAAQRVVRMDKNLQAFLDNVIDSIVKLEIALFFHGNPGALDTAQGIAARIYRRAEATTTALKALCSEGVLELAAPRSGRYELYSLSKDRQVRRLLALLEERYNADRTAIVEVIRRFVPGKAVS